MSHITLLEKSDSRIISKFANKYNNTIKLKADQKGIYLKDLLNKNLPRIIIY